MHLECPEAAVVDALSSVVAGHDVLKDVHKDVQKDVHKEVQKEMHKEVHKGAGCWQGWSFQFHY